MDEIKSQLTELWNAAPEELRTTAPGIIHNAANITCSAWTYFEKLQPIKSIADNLAEGVSVDSETANSLLSKCADNTFVGQNRDELFRGMTSDEAGSDALLQGMQEIMGDAANRIMIVGIVSGGVYAAIEGYNAYKFWQLIKDAQNLVEKIPGLRQKISDELSNIMPLVKSLDKVYADLERSDISKDDFDVAKVAADYFINEIRMKVSKFLKDINDLHFVVHGMKEKLRTTRNRALASAITGSFGSGTAITNAIILSSIANPILTGITIGLGCLQGMLALTNAIQHRISSEQLNALRIEVQNIEDLREEGLKIQRDVDLKSREFLFSTIRNRRLDLSKYM